VRGERFVRIVSLVTSLSCFVVNCWSFIASRQRFECFVIGEKVMKVMSLMKMFERNLSLVKGLREI
jgi:hypothetical protein